ncbi:protein kinase [Nocardia cyriacigeorgica]|uniref:non-specific serine/threonine protein kinase n=1 Tax=Nocardia cyriacigeorgica TaxID=135487 RepID=A0A6P1DH20_9NOCA|nr:serine/threonine-protein kinase [Nocardia cyriacigeorgica]NEW37545.1 protein kinase [Nocardia cyriacigeorgica]NEW47873.1 protein kinase [Nocardia cyriacigeorgica]NEW49067.1 protein kinase [Nocardia cyriacigeorgica]NEW59278.1 protein kinase [Nocardia cyriacigeorgica]
MADIQPTQRSPSAGIIAELNAEGFEQAEEIGRGGFGVVYRCAQPDLNRIVAVKVLTSDLDPESLQRFLREQRAMGQLSGHPHIVDVFQVGTTRGGHPYLVMPYHAHGSLEQRIRDSGPLDWVETLTLGVKIAGALEAAHRASTLHRDVKPGNILLTDYGEPQLSDFGIARTLGDFQTAAGIITGSPAFTAPEILEGDAPTVASDVYGLGATLFCALTGHVAYERRAGEQVLAHFLRVAAQPVPDLRREGLPDDVCAAIEQAMARVPAERYESAAALGEQLRAAQRHHGLPVDELLLPADSTPRISATSRSTRPRGRSTAPPTPGTKYRPPTAARTLVSRKRLLDQLRSGAGKRMTLIHAPSGFGKTTLAARWRDEICEAGGAVAWLTVDSDDDNVVWFLEHLVEAVRVPRPVLAAELEQTLEAHPEEPTRYVLTTLVNELHSADDHLTVVLDDWQRITGPDSVAAVRFLLDHGCHHLPLVVTSTSTADLPLSRLRINGELVDIDVDALRFDADEVRSFLAEAGCLRPAVDIDALTHTTDGWAVALQLAVLSLRAGEDPARLVADLSERADIGDYLAENVLETLDQDTLDFLTTTSICGRLCGGLATALTGSEHAPATLDEIEHRGLFLERVGPDRQWFRYHQIFAGYLRRRLERDRPPPEIDALHLRAAAWFARHDLLNEAVDHALAAGDPDHAIDLVEQGASYLLEHANMSMLLGILAKLPALSIQSRPRIQLWVAWVNLVLRRPSAPARVVLSRLTAALDEAAVTSAELADLRAEADVIDSVAEVFNDRIDKVDQLVGDVLSRPDDFPPRVTGVAGNIDSFAAIHRFEFDAARRRQRWTTPYHEATGPFVRVYGRCFAGIAARELLDIPAAYASFDSAYELAAETMGQRAHAARLAGALLSELRYLTGDLTGAAELLPDSRELAAEGGGLVDVMIATYATAARIEAANGDTDAAAKRLAEGMDLAEHHGLARLAARLRNERIRLGHGVSEMTVRQLLRPRSLGGADGIAIVTAELDEDSAIRLLLIRHQQDEALDRARTLADAIDPDRRPMAAAAATLLLSAALRAAGEVEEAERIREPAAARCVEVGLSQFLLDSTLGLPGD